MFKSVKIKFVKYRSGTHGNLLHSKVDALDSVEISVLEDVISCAHMCVEETDYLLAGPEKKRIQACRYCLSQYLWRLFLPSFLRICMYNLWSACREGFRLITQVIQ